MPVDANVNVTSSEDLDPATVTNATMTLRPGTDATESPMLALVTYDSATKTATLRLEEGLRMAEREKYTVEIP